MLFVPSQLQKQSSWRWAHGHDPAGCCLGNHRGRVTWMRTWLASSHVDSERFSCASASTQMVRADHEECIVEVDAVAVAPCLGLRQLHHGVRGLEELPIQQHHFWCCFVQ